MCDDEVSALVVDNGSGTDLFIDCLWSMEESYNIIGFPENKNPLHLNRHKSTIQHLKIPMHLDVEFKKVWVLGN